MQDMGTLADMTSTITQLAPMVVKYAAELDKSDRDEVCPNRGHPIRTLPPCPSSSVPSET